ncbi:MAG: RecX family transcriptional regulator [bacterium]
MKITGLKPQKRSKKRVSVFVDGEFAFSLDRETVKAFRLREGGRVDARLLEEAVLTEQRGKCQEYALLLFSYRARSEKELRQRLEKKGWTPAVIEEVIKNLKKTGLVDDEKLARRFVHDRITVGHKGKSRVKAELNRLGIAKEKIEQALKEAPDETEAAQMVLDHFLPRYQNLDPITKKRRLAGLLARRGFSLETINRLMKEKLD